MAAKNPQQYIDTAKLESDLSGRSVRGGAWASIGQFGKSLLQILSTLALARLLTPTDYGLVGMVVAVTGLLAMFKDMGLAMATVQREDITHEQVSSLFWINVALGFAVTVVAAASAWILAWIYAEPLLVGITLGLSIAFAFSGLTVQHEALMRRQMKFGQLAMLQVIALFISLVVAVVLAWNGWAYWALVAQSVVFAVANCVGVWIACGWRPSRPAWAKGLDEMIKFGLNLTGFSFVNYFARNLDDALIGRFHGAAELGLYRQAYEIFKVPLSQINQPVSKVAIPALSRLIGEPERYRRSYKRILEKLLLITMPLGAVLIVCADWIILLILGDQWEAAAPIFAMLGISIFAQAIGNTTGWLFISQDRTGEMFRWGFIGAGTAIASFLIGLPWGAVGVALAYSVVGICVRTPWLLWYVGRRGPVRTIDFYLSAWPAALTAVGVGGALFGFRQGTNIAHPAWNLVAAIPLAVVSALAILVILPRGREIMADGFVLLQHLRRAKADDEVDAVDAVVTGDEDGTTAKKDGE